MPSVNRLREPGLQRDPYPFYARLRARGPVLFDADRGQWVVTGHQEVAAALRDPALSAVRFFAGPGASAAERQVVAMLARQLLFTDAPEHARLRRLIAKAFTPRRVEGLRPAIAARTDALLDAAAERGGVDLVADLALPLPVEVIAELLGVPPVDRDRLRSWSVSFGVLLDDVAPDADALRAALAAVAEFLAYLTELTAARRADPREDLISALVTGDGDRLAPADLLANLVLLLAAGHLTTTHLLGNSVLALLRERAQWELLCAEPALLGRCVDELLRYDSPVQMTGRMVAREVVIGGVPIAAGQSVLLVLGAANRDPAVFTEPDVLDLRRGAARHLAFGHGAHACLGMALARVEAEIALGRLTARFPGLRLAETDRPEREPGLTFRGLRRLPLHLGD
ncbi:cytochrome P450 [Actinokineospora sp.]|uniref:cytochrome P450 n=1 Tax=Actinokineospora sp. TaxID=1872133 RepID=UPI0040381A82